VAVEGEPFGTSFGRRTGVAISSNTGDRFVGFTPPRDDRYLAVSSTTQPPGDYPARIFAPSVIENEFEGVSKGEENHFSREAENCYN